MKIESHIRISFKTLEAVQNQADWKINKTAYLLGSIAPDLNVAFPKHTITNTLKRWMIRVKRVNKTSSNVIKSFTLGIIMHYVCDYFCFVHNINSQGPKHTIYERVLNRHLRNQRITLQIDEDSMTEKWNTMLDQMQLVTKLDNAKQLVDGLINSSEKQLEVIEFALIKMNEIYVREVDTKINKGWQRDVKRASIDIKYAQFICNKIALALMCKYPWLDDSVKSEDNSFMMKL